MIITDISKLNKSVHSSHTKEESEEVVKKLFSYLSVYKTGTSLSSNQIGINDYRISVTNIIEPLFFINPIIIEHSNEMFDFVETCLSVPQKMINTKRYQWVKIQADNFKEPTIIGIDDKNKYKQVEISNLLNITSAVQKSIDMLDCRTILDNENEFNTIPIMDSKNKKYNRNQLISIYNSTTNKKQVVKYKYLDKFINDGWVLENN
jgi:peptide deformylase